MKLLKTIAFLGLALLASHHADASTGRTTKCTTDYGEGSSWLALTLEREEMAMVSVPYGPRGTYITQSYAFKERSCLRNGCSYLYEKSGPPKGVQSDHWIKFFPQEIVIHKYTWSGKDQKQIEFKEETLDLDCKDSLIQ
jgi:hypothetical protein